MPGAKLQHTLPRVILSRQKIECGISIPRNGIAVAIHRPRPQRTAKVTGTLAEEDGREQRSGEIPDKNVRGQWQYRSEAIGQFGANRPIGHESDYQFAFL